MRVTRGTVTSESAFIQLITLPGMPRSSPSTPIRKPGTSTRNTIGMLKESHSTMKLVAFWQASASSAPPLYCGLLRSEEHTSELQSQSNLVCRLLLEKKNKKK